MPSAPGLLKTSASAGIPGYVDSYLFAEQATLRKQAVRTEEVAAAIAFLLSPRSSGINAQGLVIDAGMGINYFDRKIVSRPPATSPARAATLIRPVLFRRAGLGEGGLVDRRARAGGLIPRRRSRP